MITSHIVFQAEAGPAAIVTAALREVPGVPGTASVAGPGDVIARTRTRDIGELTRLVASRAWAPGGVTRTAACPVVHR